MNSQCVLAELQQERLTADQRQIVEDVQERLDRNSVLPGTLERDLKEIARDFGIIS